MSVVSLLPVRLDFEPREFALQQDLVGRWSETVALTAGQSRILCYGDALLLYSGPDDGLREIVAEPPGVVPRWQLKVAGYGAGYRSDAVFIDARGRIHRWDPRGEPELAWSTKTRGLDVAALGLPHQWLLLVREVEASYQTELVDTASGTVRWRRDGALPQVLPCDDSLVALPMLGPDVICLDSATGGVRWRHTADTAPALIGAIDGHVWLSDQNGTLFALRLTDGRRVCELGLKNNRSALGVLDPQGRLHACNGLNYQVVDLAGGQARLVSATGFEGSSTTARGRLALLTTDGRLVFMDDHGKVFVVHPEDPRQPECIWDESHVFSLGIVQQHLALLDWEGQVTLLGG